MCIALALAACGGDVQAVAGADTSELAALRAENERLRGLLRGPDPTASEADRTGALRMTRSEIRETGRSVGQALETLRQADDGAATPLTQAALESAQAALGKVGEALGAAIGAGAQTVAAHEVPARPVEAALAALRDANAKLASARAEADENAAARTALDQAEISLARAAASLAPLTIGELRTLRSDLERARAALEEARLADPPPPPPPAPAPADPGLSLFASATGLSPSPATRTTLAVTRTPRRVRSDPADPASALQDNPARLVERPAVLYSEGKRIRPGAAFGDEFPLRARTLRGAISGPGQRGMPATGPARAAHLLGMSDGDDNNWSTLEGEWVGSVRLKADGLKLKAGGRSVLSYGFMNNLDVGEDSGADGKRGFPGTTLTNAVQMTQAHADQLGIPLPDPIRNLSPTEAGALNALSADNCIPSAPACWDDHMDDLTLDFGRPEPDPDGEPGYHWAGKAGLEGRDAPDRAAAVANGAPSWIAHETRGVAANFAKRAPETGEYAVYMSNYAGVDDKGTADANDDSPRYLDYMAYGMFVFTDYLSTNIRPAFNQGFHFGYDTFADAAGMRPDDFAATPESLVFEGEAMGLVLHPFGDRSQVSRVTRVRGDVALVACLGASNCAGGNTIAGPIPAANTIRGLIDNLEFRPSGSDSWSSYEWLTPGVELRPAAIADDGGFLGETDAGLPRRLPRGGGSVLPMDAGGRSAQWNNLADDAQGWTGPDLDGQWGGNFYGPKDGALEAGGWWHMYPRPGATPGDTLLSGVVGSFGARKTSE